MAWLTTEVKEDPNEPERTLNWWATYSYVEPMYYWFRGFNIALAESGIDPMYQIRIDA